MVTYRERPFDRNSSHGKLVVITFEKTLSCPALPPLQSTLNIDLSGDDDASMIESEFEVKKVTFDLIKGVLKPILYVESTFVTEEYKGPMDKQLEQIFRQFMQKLVPNLKKCGWCVTVEPYIAG